MIRSQVTIRPAVPDDAERAAQLRREVFPYLVRNAQEIRRTLAAPRPTERASVHVAEVAGRVVGWQRSALNTWTSEPSAGALELHVHPEHRRRGIGAALLATAEAHLAEIGARRIRAFAAEDSIGFARSAGYEPSRQMLFSGVDPRTLPPQPATPAGLTVVPLIAVEPRLVYDVDIAASQDEPGDLPIQPVAFDLWLEEVWHSPALDLDLSVGVLDAATCVAFTAVEIDADRAWSGMTGTLPTYRGRGLAKVAKSVALRRAADVGVVTAYTSNDASNAPMLSVNTWLGYTRVASHRSVVKKL